MIHGRGIMSKRAPPLSTKDKAIRIGASAAIAGLTASFLISESIAAKFQNPNSFLAGNAKEKITLPVLQPVLAFHDFVETVNFPSLQLPDTPLEDNAPSLFARLRDRSEQLAKLTEISKPVPAIAEKTQVDTVKISAAAPLNPGKPAISIDKNNQRIRGKIVGADGDIGGYFEVGFYGKIDSSGNPVGYPLTQQILPSDLRNFSLEKLPGLVSGYLFARLVTIEKTIPEAGRKFFAYPQNPIVFAKNDRVADLEIPFVRESAKDTVVSVAAKTVQEKKVVKGSVGAMFAKRGSFLPVAGAEIKIRGTNISTSTNARGDFSLDVTGISGDVLLEFLKPGYLASIRKVSLKELSQNLTVEIASRDAIDQMAVSLGIRQSMSKSVFLGYARDKDGKALSNLTVQTTLKGEGPYYFTDEGFPSGQLSSLSKGTTSDGRLIIFNVEAGIGVVEASLGGESIAPAPISAVEGGGLVFKELEPIEQRVRGRIFSPVQSGNEKPQAIVGARMKVEGSSEWTTTDAFGAFELPNLRYLKGEDIALEMTADKFYTHHFQLKSGISYVDLFAFPSLYISGLAHSVDVQLDPYAGIVIGSMAKGKSLRIDALSDHSSKNGSRDFYFGANQVIKGSYGQTDARYGTFVVFNAPRGRTILQGLDNESKLKASKVLHTHASTVNVVLE